MKKLLFFLFFLSLNAFSQTVIEKSDGTKITTSLAKITTSGKKVTYLPVGQSKEVKLSFDELKSVESPEYKFRVFTVKDKRSGYYIKTETPEKILAFRKYSRNIARGGFETAFNYCLIVVFDKQGNVLRSADFGEYNTNKNREEREKAAEIIKEHFRDCPKLLGELEAYRAKPMEKDNALYFFDTTDFKTCE